jgi:hypothetical protein
MTFGKNHSKRVKMVGSQILNLIPSLSFDDNSYISCLNEKYTLIPFQWHLGGSNW